MPKPMLKQPQTQAKTDTILSATQKRTNNQQTQQMDQMKLERLLRKSRSKEYMAIMQNLDAGGHVHNKHKVDEIINAIQNEFPEVDINGVMLGIVSKCYLGTPYEVHSLTISGQIIEHYKAGQPLPAGMEKARGLAAQGTYSFIEVYVDCCRCVSANGSVSVVK